MNAGCRYAAGFTRAFSRFAATVQETKEFTYVWQKKIKVNNVITFENYIEVQYLQLYNVEQMKKI